MSSDYKLPRLYVDADLDPATPLTLCDEHAHYLVNVRRLKSGEEVRVFNGRQGEWRGRLSGAGKKNVTVLLTGLIRENPVKAPALHLLFAPIKKSPMEFMIEKAVELGVTDLHPVITQRTEVRNLNTERLGMQIIGASEQSERLTVPRLHPEIALNKILETWDNKIPVLACIERGDDLPTLTKTLQPGQSCAILTGPEGGFTPDEIDILKNKPFIKPVSLGPNVLRAETAAILAVGAAMLSRAANS